MSIPGFVVESFKYLPDRNHYIFNIYGLDKNNVMTDSIVESILFEGDYKFYKIIENIDIVHPHLTHHIKYEIPTHIALNYVNWVRDNEDN